MRKAEASKLTDEQRRAYLARRKAYYQAHKQGWVEYAKAHSETIAETKRRWNRDNPDKIQLKREREKQDRIANPKRYAEIARMQNAKRRTRIQEWERNHPEKIREGRQRRRMANPEKPRAYGIVMRAIRSGKLKRQPCEVCGTLKVVAHHEDYSKPLEVNWLCRKHHNEHHRKYP